MSYKLAGLWGPQPFLSSTTARPLVNTAFTVYKRDGTTLATIYTTRTKAVSTANPTSTDAYGNGYFFADPGDYVISCNGVTQNVTVLPDSSEGYYDARRNQDTGLATPIVAENVPWYVCSADLAVLTTQQLWLTAIELPPRQLISTLEFISGATAANTPTNWWFVLADKNRLVLGISADQTSTAWAANTAKKVALAAAYTTPDYPDFYYVGMMMKATTPVSLRGPAALGNVIMANTDLPLKAGTSNTGASTPPIVGATLTAITAGVSVPYCAAS